MTPRQKLANQLLDYLAEIPEEKWTRRRFSRGEKCCALGLLGQGEGIDPSPELVDSGIWGDIRDANDSDSIPKRGACFVGDGPMLSDSQSAGPSGAP